MVKKQHFKKICIIPARGGSKRIPRKNIKDFLGNPMIEYPIKTAIESGIFDEVMVSTDDEEIKKIALNLGAKVPFARSKETANDYATTFAVLKEVLDAYKAKMIFFDYVCCIYPCTPLLTVEKLIESEQMLLNSNFDAVVPVIKYSHPIHRSLKISKTGQLEMVFKENANIRSQEFEPYYHDAGQYYFMKSSIIINSESIWECKVLPMVFTELEAQDIDGEDDWILAELKFMKKMRENNTNDNL